MFNKDYVTTADELRKYSKNYIDELNSILIEKAPDDLVDSDYLIPFMVGMNNSNNRIMHAVSNYMQELCDYNRTFHRGYADDRDFMGGGIFSMEALRQWFLENYNKIENDEVETTIRTAKKEFIQNKHQNSTMNIKGMLKSPTIVDIRFKIFVRSKYDGLSIDPSYTEVFKDLAQLLWLCSIRDNKVTEEQFTAGYAKEERGAQHSYYYRNKYTSFIRTVIESTIGNISVENPLLFKNIFVEQTYKRSKALKRMKKDSPFNYSYEFLGGLRSMKIYRGNRALLVFKGKNYANTFMQILLGERVPELILPPDLALENLQKDKFPFLPLNYTRTILKTTNKRRIRIGD